jgi:hypothetical protein
MKMQALFEGFRVWSNKKTIISEALQYHIDHKVGVDKNVFRPGSERFLSLFKEARDLYNAGQYELSESEKYYILETDIGEYALYEGEMVPLDMPMPIEEAKKKKKKNPPLNKPSLNTGGGKKWKVFVRNPKTGGIKKVTFGDKKGGLKGNWNDPEARASFAKRHKCAEKKDKTKAGYWSCRAHKYFGKNVPGRFW